MNLIPLPDKQYEILKYVGNSVFFGYFHGVFLVLHYACKRPIINLIALISNYLSGDINWVINIQGVATVTVFFIGNLKSRLKVPRPFWVYEDLPVKQNNMERTYSFPSGHTTIIAKSLLAALISDTYILWIVFCIFAILMPISRLYLCVHWVSDVVFSILLSLIICLIWYFGNPISYIVHDENSTILCSLISNLFVISSFVYYGLTKKSDDHSNLKPHTLISYSLHCSDRILLTLGNFINWKLGYVDYPTTYSNFNNIYITIMFYLSTLKAMDIILETCKEKIEKYPSLLYVLRFCTYSVGIVGGLVVPNLL